MNLQLVVFRVAEGQMWKNSGKNALWLSATAGTDTAKPSQTSVSQEEEEDEEEDEEEEKEGKKKKKKETKKRWV